MATNSGAVQWLKDLFDIGPAPPPDSRGRPSVVLTRWVEQIEPVLPAELKASAEWTSARDRARAANPDDDRRRLLVAADLTWKAILPHLTPVAEREGFGDSWRRMIETRTEEEATKAATLASRTAKRSTGGAAAACEGVAKAAWNAAWLLSWTEEWTPISSSATVGAKAAALAIAETAKVLGRLPGPDGSQAPSMTAVWRSLDPVKVLDQLSAVGVAAPTQPQSPVAERRAEQLDGIRP